MPKAVKIALIGAGSAVFSLGLVKDLCLTKELAGSHVTFMDIDEQRLQMIHRLAQRYAAELGANITFDSTLHRPTAMQGADFVINTASVVSHSGAISQKDVGQKHGYYYGRSGFASYNLRNIAFMLDVAHEMEDICPDAWLIQSGNPVFEGSTAMTRETSIKVCGLCHGHYGYIDICDMIGIDWRKVTWQAPGLNHNIWMTHFLYEGQDAYPLLDEWIATKGEEYWNLDIATRPLPDYRVGQWTAELERAWEIDVSRAAVHMYRMFGLMPIGDTPRGVGWWYHTDLPTRIYWYGKPYGGQDTELSWPLYVHNLEDRVARIARLAQDSKAKVSDEIGTTHTREQQVPIINGLVNNVEGQFQVNIPNHGALEGVADDVVVEVPAIVNQKGIQAIHVGSLPPKIMLTQILPGVLSMERQLLALKTGDRSILLWQMLDNHQTRSYQQAVETLEELITMPENKDMLDRYAWPDKW